MLCVLYAHWLLDPLRVTDSWDYAAYLIEDNADPSDSLWIIPGPNMWLEVG